MKRKLFRGAALALALSLVVALLAGCAASKNDASMDAIGYDGGSSSFVTTQNAAAEEPYAYSEKDEALNSTDNALTSGTVEAGRKLIYNASLYVQTLEYDAFMEALNAKVTELGGYVQNSYSTGRSYANAAGLRYTSVTVRIPANALDSFVNAVDGMGNITSRNVSVNDVTAQYVDVEARLTALNTERDSLLAILAKAETVEDLITVQSRLSEVNYEIESYEATKRSYDDLISYSTVSMEISEVERETVVAEEGTWEEIGRRFNESLTDVADGFVSFFIWFTGNFPTILVWVIILGGITVGIVALCRGGKKRRARRAKRAAEKEARKAAKRAQKQGAKAVDVQAEAVAEQPTNEDVPTN